MRKGRREEFSRFPEFADPERVAKIPDPCAETTFLSSKLDWSRVDAEHLAYYRKLLKTRRDHRAAVAAFHSTWRRGAIVGEQAVRVTWQAGERQLVLDANLSSSPVMFPAAKAHPFWHCGDAGASFKPWTVRWGLDCE